MIGEDNQAVAQGEPAKTVDHEMSRRRDEVVRCKEILGWSWDMVAQRFGQKLAWGLRIKTCKETLPDSDLEWLQDLAATVAAFPTRAAYAERAQAAQQQVTAREEPLVMQDTAATPAPSENGEPLVSRDQAVIDSLVLVYIEAAQADTTPEVTAARWALGRVALELGLLDVVKERIAALPPSVAAPPPAQSVWQAPEPARPVIGNGGARTPMAA